jgi:hypothetical protein
VNVACFTPAAAGVRGAATSTCEDSWVGISTSMIGPTEIDASVTWKEDLTLTLPGSQRVIYYPQGTVSVKGFTDSQGCTVTYNPSSYTVTGTGTDPHQNGGGLTIDHTQSPPTYNGSCVTEWLATITKTCPDGSGGTSPPLPTGGSWFFAQGSLAPDELSFAGTQTPIPLGQTYTFSFKRP